MTSTMANEITSYPCTSALVQDIREQIQDALEACSQNPPMAHASSVLSVVAREGLFVAQQLEPAQGTLSCEAAALGKST